MPTEPNRLFFALWPSDAVRGQCAAAARLLKARNQAGGHLIKPERLHLTLLFLGDAVPPKQEAAALAAAGEVSGAPFTLKLDMAASFRNPGHIPWWLGPHARVPELQGFYEELRGTLRTNGVSYDRGHFSPHLTVLRDAQRPLPATPIEPIAWKVSEFVLIRSLLNVHPPDYQVVGRWPLTTKATAKKPSAQMSLWEN